MKKEYRYSVIVYAAFLGVFAAGYLLYKLNELAESINDKPDYLVVAVSLVIVTALTVLVINKIVTRVYLDDEGITVRRLFYEKKMPWDSIKQVRENGNKFNDIVSVVFRGEENKILLGILIKGLDEIVDECKRRCPDVESFPYSERICIGYRHARNYAIFIMVIVFVFVMQGMME